LKPSVCEIQEHIREKTSSQTRLVSGFFSSTAQSQIEPYRYLRIFSEFNLRSIRTGIHPSPTPPRRWERRADVLGGGGNILKKGRGKVEKFNKKRKKEELL
jgi:hypothetical protein